MRGERNPPVTALPCQPPLGKGAKGTGDADCHSQCAHWLRNDTLLEIRYKPGGRTEPSAPTEGTRGAVSGPMWGANQALPVADEAR